MIIEVTKKEGNNFNIEVTQNNFLYIRHALINERNKLIKELRTYKNAGLINSLALPKNKDLQKDINIICYKKKLLKKSINQINKIFLS